jgi:putative flippase GtrA
MRLGFPHGPQSFACVLYDPKIHIAWSDGGRALSQDIPPFFRHLPSGIVQRVLRRPSGRGLSHWIHSFSLHVVTGFAAVAAHYALMYGLMRLGMAPVPASAAGFIAGALTRFALSYAHVFSPTRSVHVAGARFIVAIALQLGANTALLAGLTHGGLAVWPAQVLTTILLTFVNYLVYRWWVFR